MDTIITNKGIFIPKKVAGAGVIIMGLALAATFAFAKTDAPYISANADHSAKAHAVVQAHGQAKGNAEADAKAQVFTGTITDVNLGKGLLILMTKHNTSLNVKVDADTWLFANGRLIDFQDADRGVKASIIGSFDAETSTVSAAVIKILGRDDRGKGHEGSIFGTLNAQLRARGNAFGLFSGN